MAKAIAYIRKPETDITAPLRSVIVTGCALALILAGNTLPF